MQAFYATFEDGVLKPGQPLDLPNHARVCITIEVLEDEAQQAERLAEEQEALKNLFRLAKKHSEPPMTRDELHERR